jgi:hypothetical protein
MDGKSSCVACAGNAREKLSIYPLRVNWTSYRGISSKTGYRPVNGRKASVGEPAGTGKYRCTVSL